VEVAKEALPAEIQNAREVTVRNPVALRVQGTSVPGFWTADMLTPEKPAKRKRGKSWSHRTGQDGHIEESGRCFIVRFWRLQSPKA
jgi:hypothetical protein